MQFEAILFDCDGVLVDSEIIYEVVELECLARIGLTYERAAFKSRFTGMDPRDFRANIRADYEKVVGKPFPGSVFDEMNRETRQRFENELLPICGASGFLSELGALPRAVASSSALALLDRKLAQTGLKSHFGHHVYSGEQVTNGKPAPDLFLFAARQVGAAPENCLVIEDSINGARAGVAAGMTVWGFTGGGHIDEGHDELMREAGVAAVFSSYHDMQTALAAA
ncbi:HAD family phosphatase [Roseibium sp. RKSG952]|uniref:HAD family hydrolase n=1 Tax=Roseibium sp. RKSG952 TaxID=2529384 RepID=UPI0012BB67D0|nr:HAD family hydrolase [Roseibium sp. RKSG952]MTH98221.1 HAD family hydrolase [Roseibium sp. RKSG952]